MAYLAASWWKLLPWEARVRRLRAGAAMMLSAQLAAPAG